MQRSAPRGFGWADALGPLAILSNVAVVCLWLMETGLASLSTLDSAIGSVGLLTGLLSSNLMILQVLMLARIPWVERAWGHDLLTRRHRLAGFASFWLLVVHIVAFMIQRADRAGAGWFQAWWQLFVVDSWMLWATVGTIMIIAVVILSIRAARRRIRYEPWHLLHLYAYLGMALGFPHQLADGADFHQVWAQVYWWALYLGTLAAVIAYRVVLPIIRSARHELRVSSVVAESRDVVSVTVTGRDLEPLRTRSGQFFVWRFLDGPGWTRGNPYTISAAPRDTELRVTIQAAGDGSARAANLLPGTRVFVEGPYGTMTAGRRRHPHVLLMAAGIGITPIRALLEDMPYEPGEATLAYRYSRAADAIFTSEIDALRARRGLTVQAMPGPRRRDGSWLPDQSRFAGCADATVLSWLVPDITATDIFVCGPLPWIHAVRDAAIAAGARPHDIHTEDFSW